MSTPLQSLGEFGLIARVRRHLTVRTPEIRIALGDDAAVLALAAGDETIVTTDLLIEGVHFRRDWTSARDLGWKSLAVNLSDLAAMGAAPLAAFIGLGLPADLTIEWVDEFYTGLEECAAEFGATIAGGDTTAAPEALMISVTLLGTAAAGKALLRSGAQAGDALVVTGTLGDSAAGLRLLRRAEVVDSPLRVVVTADVRSSLVRKHNEPAPRLREVAAAMRVATLHAAIDLSDGLAGDAGHLAESSNVSIEIDEDALPISAECRAACQALAADPIELALRGGEDYELLLAVAPDEAARVMAAINQVGAAATVVGRVTASSDHAVIVRQPSGTMTPVARGFEHFGNVSRKT